MIRFSLKNPLLVNLVLALVAALGLIGWHAMPQEMFPTFARDAITVTTVFEGASPEEIERQITTPVEDALDGLADIDSVTSTSQEGLSTVRYKLLEGADADELLREMRTLVDAIDDFPVDADTPQIMRGKHYIPVISVALHGDAPLPVLYDRAERLRRELLQLPGVSGVGLVGKRDRELWVEADPRELAARGVTLAEVRAALRGNLRDTPSGTIRSGEGDILLRGRGTDTAAAIEQVAVRRNERGGQLRLGELAAVSARLEEAETLGRFNGAPSVNLSVSKSARASTYEVRDRVRALVEGFRLPPGVAASLFADMSVPIETRINTVQSSGVVALVLLLFSLYFLLNFRMALITALGIPVAMLGAVIVMALLGYSINLVSMFAFLVVLGLVVDDAIIVSENVYRHMELGRESHEAAYIGAREVMWPVLASICTSVAAFIPMFGITGLIGKFVEVIPVVVTAALLGSLLEAFLILPSHAAEVLRLRPADRSRARWEALLARYRAVLAWSAERRYLVAALAFGALLVTLAYMATRLPYTQFGDIEMSEFMIDVEAPNTYGLDDSHALARRIERIILDTVRPDELDSLQTNVGVSLIDFSRYRLGSHYVQFAVNLTQAAPDGFLETYVNPLLRLELRARGERERGTEAIMAELRAALKTVPGIRRLAVQRPQAGPAGADVEVGVVGPELDGIREQAEAMRDYLARLPGVEDARHDLDPGKVEYQYALNARGRELGLTQTALGAAVRTGYQGDKVLYVSQGDERVPVRLLYPPELRRDAAGFARLPVTTDAGVVYLDEVADIRATRGLAAVHRRDGERMATVTADLDAETSAGEVAALLDREFGDRFARLPGYRMMHLGAKRESRTAVSDMLRAVMVALAIIFFILAALFRSLLDPLVVMTAIPYALIGVVIGHAAAGIHLQFLSLIGLLALSGVVVNDSLILIDFVKKLRAAGHDRMEALLEGSRARFRPIFLTTITTFLGVSPLIFFASGQTRFLMPMAISLGFGLLFATVVILLVVPCFYLIADDLRAWTAARAARLPLPWRQPA